VEEIGISLVNICSFFHKDGWLDFERLVVKTVVVGPVNMTKLTVPLELNAEDKDEGEHIPESMQLPYFKSSFFLKVEITTNTGTEERIFPRHFAINLPIEMVSRVLVLSEAKRLDRLCSLEGTMTSPAHSYTCDMVEGKDSPEGQTSKKGAESDSPSSSSTVLPILERVAGALNSLGAGCTI